MVIRLLQNLPLQSLEEALERLQGSVPLQSSAPQGGHDRPVLHGEEPGVLAEAESAQGVEGVDHVDRVAAGADHAGRLLELVLLGVGHDVAAPLHFQLHVAHDVLESSMGDEAHVGWEENDVSAGQGVLVIGNDVGDVCL